MPWNKLTHYLDSLSDAYGIPAVDCRITRGYEVVYRHAAGYADAGKTRPVSPADLYFLYSATKVVTVAAVMQLVERGLLRLGDRVDQYLPAFATMRRMVRFPDQSPLGSALPDGSPLPETVPAVAPMRIADLMAMTAGMTYDIQSREIVALREKTAGQATTRQMMDALAAMPLAYEPGERWMYSLAHDVLAGIVEVATGQSFSAYLRGAIFDPLDMRDAYFTPTPDQFSRMSAQYSGETGTVRPVPTINRYRLSDSYESGGAGLICTVDAYGRFVEALCNGGVGSAGKRILTPESIDQLRQNRLTGQRLTDFNVFGKPGYGYGLGVRTLIDPSASRSPLGEFGWDGAAGAYLLADPENHIGIFLAEHVLSFPKNYSDIHPTVRDLAYEALIG